MFVGANQQPPKAARQPATVHRFSWVDFLKVKAAGETRSTSTSHSTSAARSKPRRSTECFVLSRDKGYDPLAVAPEQERRDLPAG